MKNGLIQHGYSSYDEYKERQIRGNKEKVGEDFEIEDNIKILSEYLQKNLDDIKFGICHGTKRGKEQAWFKKYLGIDVLGTEISDNAFQYPNTIEWDFHKIKPEWVNKVDFIYSNALDHSFDAKFCLTQWFHCLREEGICIINGTTAHLPYFTDKLDPFGYTRDGLTKLINSIGPACHVKIETVLDAKIDPNKKYRSWYYVIIRKQPIGNEFDNIESHLEDPFIRSYFSKIIT